ncbi:DUF6119 family protein [Bradyrhizobium iriomotense]|uniref:Sporadically distributed protein, TIGR04141 family n=1 Tax=Bradyrhizobium iriomotense TaxID=441950 RepID=A0ABQ6BA75_9BRAD|nr:DUF6119 family protein [Bradyrhizobium iriomotense]GLR90334.1 hypothetical protein GCM10007857_70490 [Bradyrhizobium iriomotense]
MARGPKKQRLNIFLIKPGVGIDQVVRDDVGPLDRRAIRKGLNFSGIIFTKGTPANPPSWTRFVQQGAEEALGLLFNQSASGLIILTAAGRMFAIAFGFGRHWIEEAQIVRRFGMIVSLNVVHPDRIRSVDREEFDTIQRKTRSQTSISSNIDSFGLNIQRDLVRSVTGQPEDTSFAAHVTGADNLIMSVALTFEQLGDKCAQALGYFSSNRYRDRYAWIDNFNRLADPVKVAELDARLVEEIRTGAPENAYLTPPDTLDTQEHRGFLYPRERKGVELHPDLRMEEWLSAIDDPRAITLEYLRRWKFREFTVSEEIPRQFTVYDAIIYEVTQGTKLYVLSFGEWFEIAQDHVATVNGQVAQIREHSELNMIDARSGETEGEYNRRAAASSNGEFVLLDAKSVAYGGGRSSIEICDLLSLQRVFIHVKAKTKSATLSHLFAQGLNSAQAFRDHSFRQLAIAKCPNSHQALLSGEPRIDEFTVTYAIITHARGNLRDALPFFSKQSLANAAQLLRNMGYQVRLKKIAVI